MPFQSRTIKGFDLLAKYLFPAATSGAKHPAHDPVEELVNSTVANSETSQLLENPTTTPHAEFLLLLGDFVHPSIPRYTSDVRDAYRKYYRRNYGTTYRKVYERLRMLTDISSSGGTLTALIIAVFHTHDFAGRDNGSESLNVNASQAFKAYIADANYDSSTKGQNYYDFRYGDVAFFVLDTHDPKIGDDDSMSSMLGDKQLGALSDWLAKVAYHLFDPF
jgi:alkaline phosphatase D